MKKCIYLGCTSLILMLFATCTTVDVSTEPRTYTHTSMEYEILGEVIYESKDRVGYIELLKSARNMYPDCDYVIDIMVDQKKTVKRTIFFVLISESDLSTFVMRGTAIKYKY